MYCHIVCIWVHAIELYLKIICNFVYHSSAILKAFNLFLLQETEFPVFMNYFVFDVLNKYVSKCKVGGQSLTISYYLGKNIFDFHFEQCLPILFDSTAVV